MQKVLGGIFETIENREREKKDIEKKMIVKNSILLYERTMIRTVFKDRNESEIIDYQFKDLLCNKIPNMTCEEIQRWKG